jgi:hypothetical protein
MIKKEANLIQSIDASGNVNVVSQTTTEKSSISSSNISAFENSNLWIRFVNKREKITQLINMAYNSDKTLSEDAKKKLSSMFREELSGYKSMYFNTTNDEAGKFWQIRNRLTPLLNSILFLPKLSVTIENPTDEGKNITYNNELDLLLSNLLPKNDNINKTQIENLESVLKRMKLMSNPAGHQDLKNTIRINSFETKWIVDDFLTQEGTLEVWVEHHQLLKSDFVKELLRLNKRIDIQTGFYRPFENATQFFSFLQLFVGANDEEFPITWDEYNEFLDAAELEMQNTHWVINNFNIKYDENNAATITINLAKFAVTPLKQSSMQSVKLINLLTADVIKYFKDNGIVKLTVVDPKKAKPQDGTIYVPLSVVENNNTRTASWSKENSEYMTFMVLDEARFIMYLIWLYANKYADYFDETEGVVNNKKFNRNFLVTIEVDASLPNTFNGYRERFNGGLMSYVDTSLEDKNDGYISFSLFDWKKVNNWFNVDAPNGEQKYTDFAIPFRSTFNLADSQTKTYKWNQNSMSEIIVKSNEDSIFKEPVQEYVYMSLVAEYIQEDMIVANETKIGTKTQSSDSSSIKTGTNNSAQCEPKSFLQRSPQVAATPSQKKEIGAEKISLTKIPENPLGNGTVDCNSTKFTAARKAGPVKYSTYIPPDPVPEIMEQLRKEGIQRIAIESKPPLVYIFGKEIQTSNIKALIDKAWSRDKNYWYPALYWTNKDSRNWIFMDQNGKVINNDQQNEELPKPLYYTSSLATFAPNVIESYQYRDANGMLVTVEGKVTPNKSIAECEKLTRQLAEEVIAAEKNKKDCLDKMKESIEEQAGVGNAGRSVEPEKNTTFFSYHFTFPYYKVAVSDDMWLKDFDTFVLDFVVHSIKRVNNSRRNASYHVSNPNITSKINLTKKENDLKITFDKKKNNTKYEKINEVIWERSDKRIEDLKDNKKKETLIESQLSNPESIKIVTIPRNSKSYSDNFDENTLKFINEHILVNNNEDWLEIKITDFDQLWLTKAEQEIYSTIQKNIFNEMDKNAIVKVNQMMDNNVINIQPSSEMISDMPYELGVFNTNTLNQDTYGERIKNIRENIKNINTLPDEDKLRIQNSLDLMGLISSNSDQRSSVVKDIIDWTVKVKDNLDSYKLFNSISGSYFLTNVADVGVRERLMPTLYDLLYYTVDCENWYVPKFRPFTPLFLYTGGNSAIELYRKMIENPEISPNAFDVDLLNQRISPQSGLYYITEMTEKFSSDGLWLQNWKGKKYDQGFLSLIYNELFKENNVKVHRSNVLDVLNDDYNFFNIIYSMSPTLFDTKSKYINLFQDYIDPSQNSYILNSALTEAHKLFHIDQKDSIIWSWIEQINKLLYHKNNFNNTIDENDMWKETYRSLHLNLILLYIYILNELSNYDGLGNIITSDSIFGNKTLSLNSFSDNQNLWPINNADIKDNFTSLISSINGTYSPYGLKNKFQDKWFKYYPIRYYDYSPEFLRLCNEKIWECLRITTSVRGQSFDTFSTDFMTLWNGKINESSMYDISDAYISVDNLTNSKSKVYESIGSFKTGVTAGSSVIDIGTIITVQRYDHTSIDENNLSPETYPGEYVEIGGEKITSEQLFSCDTIKVKDKEVKNFAWRTIEKYLILDAPMTFSIVKDMVDSNYMSNFKVAKDNSASSISSWDDYVHYSLNTETKTYEYLKKFGLAFGQRLYDVSNSREYIQDNLVRYAWVFLVNYHDDYGNFSKTKNSDNRLSVSERINSKPPKYEEMYKNYFDNYDTYKEKISDANAILRDIGLFDLYQTEVIDKVNNQLDIAYKSSTSMFDTTNKEQIDKLDQYINNLYEKYKKNYAAIIFNDILYKFLIKWLDRVKLMIERQIDSKQTWTNCFSPLPFDFIEVPDSNNLFDTTRFCAIRWTYDGTKTPISDMFGGEFVANMSLKQLTYEDARQEDPMLELAGVDVSKTSDIYEKRQSFDKVFYHQNDIDKYKEKYGDNFTYDFNIKNQKLSDKSYFQNKYGRIRWVVNDEWTYNKFMTNGIFDGQKIKDAQK